MRFPELLHDLYRHMEWADAAIWTAVLAHPPAGADAVTRERLHHIHMVQQAFLAVWRGVPYDRKAGEGLEPAALAGWARPFYADARAHLAAVPEEGFAETVALPWAGRLAAVLGFEPGPTTLGETATQLITHSVHHRGQVTARLRELGATPPNVDYIAWIWRRRPDAVWP